MCLCPIRVGCRSVGCRGVSFVFYCWVLIVFSLVLVGMVEVLSVWFPLGRVCLGTYSMCCVFGDHLYLGSLVVGLAWGIRRCVCSG